MIKKVNIMRGMLSGWTTEKHLKEKSTMINHRDQHSVAELGSIFASHSSAVYMYVPPPSEFGEENGLHSQTASENQDWH